MFFRESSASGGEYRVLADASLWRVLGASTFALVNKRTAAPDIETFAGESYLTWFRGWRDGNSAINLLTVRETVADGTMGPAMLSIFSPAQPDGLQAYKRYLFLPDPDTQHDEGYMCALSGTVNRSDPESVASQNDQINLAFDLGTAVANGEDLGELYGAITQAPIHILNAKV